MTPGWLRGYGTAGLHEAYHIIIIIIFIIAKVSMIKK